MKKLKHSQFGKSLFLITISILVALNLIVGSWETVSAAQYSLPGDLLYAVKLAQEELQLAFTSDTQTRIELLTTFADQRAKEAAALALLGRPVPDELPTLIEGYLGELTLLTASMDEATQQEVLDGVQRHLRPRDQDQGMTGPINSPVHDDNNPPPQDMNKNGKGQDSADTAVEESETSIVDLPTVESLTINNFETSATQTTGPGLVSGYTAPLADEYSPGLGFDQIPGSRQPATSNAQGKGGQP